MNAEDILVDNLRDVLRQAERQLAWALGTSITFLFLMVSDPKIGLIPINLLIPSMINEVRPGFARLIALTTYWVLGTLATYSVERSQRIFQCLLAHPTLAKAMETFPSLVTAPHPGWRYMPAILPPILVLGGEIIWIVQAWDSLETPPIAFLGLFMMALPYVALVWELHVFSKAIKGSKKKKHFVL